MTYQERYASNMALLKKSGLKYDVINNKCVRIDKKIDFWPGSNCYIEVGFCRGYYDGFSAMVDELKRIRKRINSEDRKVSNEY